MLSLGVDDSAQVYRAFLVYLDLTEGKRRCSHTHTHRASSTSCSDDKHAVSFNLRCVERK